LKTPSPYCYRCPIGKTPNDCSIDCADQLKQALQRANGRVCAVILEPGVQAAAGMLTLPAGFLSRVADACRAHDALLILDEVATGFGRTGMMFACQREDVRPDLMCVAKGLTGGYLPVAATLATDRVYDAFLGRYDEYRHFFHGHTYTGNALGCAAALATLGLLADGTIIGAVEHKANVLRDALRPLGAHRHVGDIRQAGLMCGIELVADRPTKTSFAPGDRNGYHICLSLRDRGIFLRPLGDVVVLMPPLSSTDEELQHLARSVQVAIEEWFGA
jgi:adenosylmethionine-8-amino-7-oxononanoate aminotransferase